MSITKLGLTDFQDFRLQAWGLEVAQKSMDCPDLGKVFLAHLTLAQAREIAIKTLADGYQLALHQLDTPSEYMPEVSALEQVIVNAYLFHKKEDVTKLPKLTPQSVMELEGLKKLPVRQVVNLLANVLTSEPEEEEEGEDGSVKGSKKDKAKLQQNRAICWHLIDYFYEPLGLHKCQSRLD